MCVCEWVCEEAHRGNGACVAFLRKLSLKILYRFNSREIPSTDGASNKLGIRGIPHIPSPLPLL